MDTIQEYWLKIKGFFDRGAGEWGLPIILILVGFCSFGLGRLSALEEAKPPITVLHAPLLPEPQGIYPGGQVVGSTGGQVYYYPWCSGAEKISSDKQRWFASEAAAQKAGYRPAKNCKGLASQ